MGVTILTIFALALTLAADNRLLFITGTRAPPTMSTHAPQTNRTSKELFADKPRSIPDPVAMDLKTTGRKLSADDYNTFSSLTSDVVVETSSSNAKLYPSLTTSYPTFVTRGRFIRNPFYFSKDDQEVEFDDEQHADLMMSGGMPKWNRFNNNHRQLNKYGPAPIEADITVDEDGSTGYGSAFDFGGTGGGLSGYDSGSYRAPSVGWGAGGDSMMGWYNEPISQPSRPVPIIAEIRHPSHKMSVDLTKIGMVAMIKIAIAKLKALGFIKAMLLVLFKLKLLILIIAVKSLALAKFLKVAMIVPALFSFLTFPMFFTRLSRLLSLLKQPVLIPNSFGPGATGSSAGGTGGTTTGTGGDGEATRRSRLDPSEVPDPGMAVFRQILRSEKCVERISCRMAGSKKPSLSFIWMNWAISPVSKYIPSKKIRTFVSTFTEVTNYRLDNMYNNMLPKNWTKWCDDHYSCDEAKNKL